MSVRGEEVVLVQKVGSSPTGQNRSRSSEYWNASDRSSKMMLGMSVPVVTGVDECELVSS